MSRQVAACRSGNGNNSGNEELPAVPVSLALSTEAVYVFRTRNHSVRAVFGGMLTREVKISAGGQGPQLTMRASKLALHC